MKHINKMPYYIRKRVLTDMGQASMCWEHPEGAGVFDTTQAIEIGDALCQFIRDEIKKGIEEAKKYQGYRPFSLPLQRW